LFASSISKKLPDAIKREMEERRWNEGDGAEDAKGMQVRMSLITTQKGGIDNVLEILLRGWKRKAKHRSKESAATQRR